jgi:hypothetical protein
MIEFIGGCAAGLFVGGIGAFFVVKNNLAKTQELFAKVDLYNGELGARLKVVEGLLRQISAAAK